MTATRVTLAGAGRFGALHARVWTEAGANLVGVADVDVGKAGVIASRFGGAVSVDAAGLLRDLRPDALIVASDEASHEALVHAGLDAGAHVFVEKPFALSTAGAVAIAGHAAAANRHVIAGHISRFAEPYRAMAEACAAGTLGELWTMRLRRDFSRQWFRDFGGRIHPAWESCVHDIDLAVLFAGARARRVTAQQSSAAGDAAPSVVTALVEFESGVTATIESAWTVPSSAPETSQGALALTGAIVAEAELHGSVGIARQRLLNDGLTLWTDAGAAAPNPTLWPQTGGQVGGAMRAQIDHALALIEGRLATNYMPIEDAVRGIEIAEAIVHSLENRVPVDLPERELCRPFESP